MELREIIRECIKSDDIYKCYLENEKMIVDRKNNILEIVAKAPISLKRKYEIFSELSELESDEEKAIANELFDKCKNNTAKYSQKLETNKELTVFDAAETYTYYKLFSEFALKELNNPRETDVFMLEYNCYENPFGKEDGQNFYAAEPCLSLDEAMRRIQYELDLSEKELMDPDWDVPLDVNCVWFKLRKYIRTNNGLEEVCSYIFKGKEICWFSIESTYCKEDKDKWKSLLGFELFSNILSLESTLNLPTPFEPGDIIEVDYRPFAPIVRAIILAKDNNTRGVDPQCLTFNNNGIACQGALKYSTFAEETWLHSVFMISPLYSARKLSRNELSDEVLKYVRIQKMMNGSEKVGRRIEKIIDIFGHEETTFDEINDYLTNKLEFKIWLDDERQAPKGHVWCRTVDDAKNCINEIEKLGEMVSVIDMDHDLGENAPGGDGIKLLDWLVERNTLYPVKLHTMNPVGRQNMERLLARYWR